MQEETSSVHASSDMDFLTKILLDGQELDVAFSTVQDSRYIVSGTIKIKEQNPMYEPQRGFINNPKVVAWMKTHPKYWKILCGIESADAKTNIKLMGMLLHADLTELAQMIARRIDVMLSPLE
jgi:hypothetical protein